MVCPHATIRMGGSSRTDPDSSETGPRLVKQAARPDSNRDGLVGVVEGPVERHRIRGVSQAKLAAADAASAGP